MEREARMGEGLRAQGRRDSEPASRPSEGTKGHHQRWPRVGKRAVKYVAGAARERDQVKAGEHDRAAWEHDDGRER